MPVGISLNLPLQSIDLGAITIEPIANRRNGPNFCFGHQVCMCGSQKLISKEIFRINIDLTVLRLNRAGRNFIQNGHVRQIDVEMC